MFKFFLLITFLFSSCATQEYINASKEVELSKKLSISLEKFGQIIPKNAIVEQFISFERSDKSEQAQVIIKNTKELQLTMLSPFGIELLSLKFENGKIIKISGIPGIKIKYFERAMADMLAIYGDKDLLLKQIRGDFDIIEAKRSRSIRSGANEVIRIKYSGEDFWKSEISFKHQELQYELIIKTTAITYENVY